jgi:hypothetical protein
MRDDLLILSILIISIVFSFVSLRDVENLKIVKKDFSDKLFVFFIFIVLGITFWGLEHDNPKIRRTVEVAFIAFITSYASRINMTITIFFIVALFTYYRTRLS